MTPNLNIKISTQWRQNQTDQGTPPYKATFSAPPGTPQNNIYFNFTIQKFQCSLAVIFTIPPTICSIIHFIGNCSLFRRPISPKAHCSENPLVWKPNSLNLVAITMVIQRGEIIKISSEGPLVQRPNSPKIAKPMVMGIEVYLQVHRWSVTKSSIQNSYSIHESIAACFYNGENLTLSFVILEISCNIMCNASLYFLTHMVKLMVKVVLVCESIFFSNLFFYFIQNIN